MQKNAKFLISGYFIKRVVELSAAGALGGATVAMIYGHDTVGYVLICVSLFGNLLMDALGRSADELYEKINKSEHDG